MIKRLLKTITVLCLLCGFFVPVRVSADNESSYTLLIGGECTKVLKTGYQNKGNNFYSTDTDVRAILLYDPNGDGNVILMSETRFKANNYYSSSDIPSCSVPSNYVNNTYVKNNVTYYYLKNNNYNFGKLLSLNPQENESFIKSYIRDYSYNDILDQAYYYLFGEGAVDPAPPGPDYGNLIDVRFNTDIAGSGTAAVNNIDHIKWNPDNDSNGVTFDGSERVEIQAIPGNYTASSKNSLLSLGVTDFDYNSGTEHLLAELPVTNGEYTVSWSHVIQQLNAGSVSDFLGIRKSSDTWLKSGWIYQIRLVAGDYVSAWQTIYNATSSGVQNSLTVENSTEINMELVNVIQSINTMNSSQYESWTINNITINMENSDGQQTTAKPWWAYLLEAIVKAFGDVLAFLGNLIGDLMDAITDLFTPAEFTINEYNEFKVELKQNSGLFGQAIDFTNNLKNTFMGVQYQEPILHWQGISFDGIVFLPAADYNLNEYVTMWGLGNFRQIAYVCSDGFIFFSLLLLIIRKLNEVLKK